MTDIKCDSCERMLKEDELLENRRDEMPMFMSIMPEPKERECFICFVERADLDGPNNNLVPTHEKNVDAYHKTLANFKKLRDN